MSQRLSTNIAGTILPHPYEVVLDTQESVAHASKRIPYICMAGFTKLEHLELTKRAAFDSRYNPRGYVQDSFLCKQQGVFIKDIRSLEHETDGKPEARIQETNK